MAVINLYKVTKTLMDLLKENITKNIDPSLSGPMSELTVTAIPPEKVDHPSNTLSLYLYHVAEDAYFKNALGPGSDVPNVAKTPMALSLFYILTAHHETESTFDAETQQKLMGYALKSFHDFPVVTDHTQINGTPIFDDELRSRNNQLQIILRPVSPEDAVSFWNSEDQRTTRLSAYYEVRVVMLEPEPPASMPGIVLNLGTFLIQMGAPSLARSQSMVRFILPEVSGGGTVHHVEASPARVTLDTSASPPEAHNHLILLGTNVTIGWSRILILKNGLWAKLPPPDGPVEHAPVDLAHNPTWAVTFEPDRVSIQLRPTLTYVKPDATSVALPVLPGMYTALVRVVKEEHVVGGQLKQVAASSNEISFTVAPRITGHEAPDGMGNVRVNLGPEFDPLDARLPEDAIAVIVDGEVYTRSPVDPPAQPREFSVMNSPSHAIRLNPHFTTTVSEPQAHPFRLIVNGAEAAPFWVEITP